VATLPCPSADFGEVSGILTSTHVVLRWALRVGQPPECHPDGSEGYMAICLTCRELPTALRLGAPACGRVHELRSRLQTILDFLWVAKSTIDSSVTGGITLGVLPGMATRRTRGWTRAGTRRLHAVASPCDLPQSDHAGPACLTAMAGTASGKEIPMARYRRPAAADESHESAKKNLTRRLPHTLRSCPSSQNAETMGDLILIHGATDANGR
jgi:hypothetical protein